MAYPRWPVQAMKRLIQGGLQKNEKGHGDGLERECEKGFADGLNRQCGGLSKVACTESEKGYGE